MNSVISRRERIQHQVDTIGGSWSVGAGRSAEDIVGAEYQGVLRRKCAVWVVEETRAEILHGDSVNLRPEAAQACRVGRGASPLAGKIDTVSGAEAIAHRKE